MASLQQLDLMANNKNASDSSGEDDTSSEDEASAKVEGQFDDATTADDETNDDDDDDDDDRDDGGSSDSNVAGMAVDSPHSESKPRIKLHIRSSLSSTGSHAKSLPLHERSERDGVNGTKPRDFTNNGGDENKKPPRTLHLVRPAAAATVAENASTGTTASRINNSQTKPVAAANATLPAAVKQEFVDEESTPSVAGKQEVDRQKTSVAVKEEHEAEPVTKKQKIMSNPNGSKPHAAAPVVAPRQEIIEDSKSSGEGGATVVGIAKHDPATAAIPQTKPSIAEDTQKKPASSSDAQPTAELKIKSEPATVSQGQPMTEFKINPETVATANGAFKVPSASSGANADPNKKKLMKRKLPGLPLSMKRKLPLKGDKGDSTGDTVVKAQVVDINDNGEEDVVATVVEEAPSSASVAPAKGKTSKSQTALGAGLTKRKSQSQSRPLRMPPMTSPGLLIPKSQAGMYRSDVDANGFVTPATIFEQSMAAAGYTFENRTKHPHRGSSVKRVVADMFDSNVAFALYFPDLVPKYLWYEQPEQPEELGEENDREDTDKKDGDKLDDDTNVDENKKDDDTTGLEKKDGDTTVDEKKDSDAIVDEKKDGNTTVDEKKDSDTTVDEKKDKNANVDEMKVSDTTVDEKKDGDATGNIKEDLPVSNTSATVISQPKTPLPYILMKSLEKDLTKSDKHGLDQASMNGRENGPRKRRRPLQFSDMIPTSLTLPYPESYLDKRMEYVKEVQEREKAIVAYQEMQLRLEFEQEENGNSNEDESPTKIKNPVKVPPIPTPPAPPPLSDFKGIDPQLYEDQHPIYLPRGKQNFVAHLDKNCFHITEGCYFGLSSNFIADPHYVGPNAPGITAANIACGSGLATQSTSTGSTGHAGGAVLALAPSNIPLDFDLGNPVRPPAPKKKNPFGPKPPKKSAPPPPVSKPAPKPAPKAKVKVKHVGPTPTANASDLRKIMEGGGDLAAEMRKCIIRAAVHASRSGKHVQSFLAPDGKAYPDVSKSFAAHAGLKPCQRCKNNKQGAYHCRLRRKHKEPDYDGGNSYEELGPFLTESKDAK